MNDLKFSYLLQRNMNMYGSLVQGSLMPGKIATSNLVKLQKSNQVTIK